MALTAHQIRAYFDDPLATSYERHFSLFVTEDNLTEEDRDKMNQIRSKRTAEVDTMHRENRDLGDDEQLSDDDVDDYEKSEESSAEKEEKDISSVSDENDDDISNFMQDDSSSSSSSSVSEDEMIIDLDDDDSDVMVIDPPRRRQQTPSITVIDLVESDDDDAVPPPVVAETKKRREREDEHPIEREPKRPRLESAILTNLIEPGSIIPPATVPVPATMTTDGDVVMSDARDNNDEDPVRMTGPHYFLILTLVATRLRTQRVSHHFLAALEVALGKAMPTVEALQTTLVDHMTMGDDVVAIHAAHQLHHVLPHGFAAEFIETLESDMMSSSLFDRSDPITDPVLAAKAAFIINTFKGWTKGDPRGIHAWPDMVGAAGRTRTPDAYATLTGHAKQYYSTLLDTTSRDLQVREAFDAALDSVLRVETATQRAGLTAMLASMVYALLERPGSGTTDPTIRNTLESIFNAMPVEFVTRLYRENSDLFERLPVAVQEAYHITEAVRRDAHRHRELELKFWDFWARYVNKTNRRYLYNHQLSALIQAAYDELEGVETRGIRGHMFALDPGLGKTGLALTVILFVDELLKASGKQVGRTLIVAPAATFPTGWRKAVGDFFDTVAVVQHEFMQTYKPGEAVPPTSHTLLVSIDTLSHMNEEKVTDLANQPWSRVIVDESHLFVNKEANRFKRLLRIIDATPDTNPRHDGRAFTYLLSGTPLLRTPVDLVRQFQLAGFDGDDTNAGDLVSDDGSDVYRKHFTRFFYDDLPNYMRRYSISRRHLNAVLPHPLSMASSAMDPNFRRIMWMLYPFYYGIPPPDALERYVRDVYGTGNANVVLFDTPDLRLIEMSLQFALMSTFWTKTPVGSAVSNLLSKKRDIGTNDEEQAIDHVQKITDLDALKDDSVAWNGIRSISEIDWRLIPPPAFDAMIAAVKTALERDEKKSFEFKTSTRGKYGDNPILDISSQQTRKVLNKIEVGRAYNPIDLLRYLGKEKLTEILERTEHMRAQLLPPALLEAERKSFLRDPSESDPQLPGGREFQPSKQYRVIMDALAAHLHSGHKVVVIATHRDMLSLLGLIMTTILGIRPYRKGMHEQKEGEPLLGAYYAHYSSSTSAEAREVYLKEFAKPGSPLKVFLTTIHMGGTGIELQAANVLIFIGSTSYPLEKQGGNRVARFGQVNDVIIYKLRTVFDNEYCDQAIREALQSYHKKISEAMPPETAVPLLARVDALLSVFSRAYTAKNIQDAFRRKATTEGISKIIYPSAERDLTYEGRLFEMAFILAAASHYETPFGRHHGHLV